MPTQTSRRWSYNRHMQDGEVKMDRLWLGLVVIYLLCVFSLFWFEFVWGRLFLIFDFCCFVLECLWREFQGWTNRYMYWLRPNSNQGIYSSAGSYFPSPFSESVVMNIIPPSLRVASCLWSSQDLHERYLFPFLDKYSWKACYVQTTGLGTRDLSQIRLGPCSHSVKNLMEVAAL